MISAYQVEDKAQSELSPFVMIYQAAKEQNEDKLMQALQLASINVINDDEDCPVTQLAFENDIRSVNFLLKFNASQTYAIKGFAKGNHIENADDFLKKLKQQNSKKLQQGIDMMAQGLGLGGHLPEAYSFLETYINVRNRQQSSSISCNILQGLINGKHKLKADEFLLKMNEDQPVDAELMGEMSQLDARIQMLIQTGDMQVIQAYLNEIARAGELIGISLFR
jgi:hypothetical protein